MAEIKPEQVPDEAYRAWQEALFSDKGGRAAIAAALNAWPGMFNNPDGDYLITHRAVIILPLPTETDNGSE